MLVHCSYIVDDLAEHFRLLCDEIGESFPINLNICFFQMIHKQAVRKPA